MACLCLALCVSACANGLSKPFGQPGSAVKTAEGDRYIIFFTRDQIEAFGAPRINHGYDRELALQKLFQKHPHLLPPACTQNGIKMISSGDGEGGKAFAFFRCS